MVVAGRKARPRCFHASNTASIYIAALGRTPLYA